MSMLSNEDYSIIDKMVYKDNGITVKSLLGYPKNEVFVWNKGIIIFQISDNKDDDKMCKIFLLYKSKDSKVDWKVTCNEFWKFLRKNGCKKVLMYTKMKPEFWIKNYDFKLKRYEMELEL